MIKEIELSNFKSHKKTQLKFTERNNIFVGISGSGKSTILDAICFAFFGTTPKIHKRKIRVSDLIMNKPIREELAKIKINFEVDKKNYEIRREICLDRPPNAELRENEKLIAINQAQVTEAVEHILKIDYELFSRAIYAEQDHLDYFLTLPPGNRIEYIDQLLKLSKFELARIKTTSISNKFKSLKNAKEETLSGFDENELKNTKKEAEDYLGKLSDEISSSKDKIKKLDATLKESVEKLKNLEEKKTKIEERKNKLIELKTTISVFQNEIKETPKKRLGEVEKELKNKETVFNNLEKKELEREKEESTLLSKINESEKRVREKKEAELFLQTFDEEKFSLLEKEIEELKETLINNKLKKQGLDNAIKNLKESKERCPTCDRELKREKREELINKKEGESFLLNKKDSELENKLLSKKQEFEFESKNREKANFFKKRAEQLKRAEQDLSNFKKRLEVIKHEKIDLSDIGKEVRDLKTLLEKLKLVETKKQEVRNLKQEQEKIENEIKKISFDELEFDRLKKEVEEAKRSLSTTKLDLKYKEEMKTEKEKSLGQIKKDLEFLQKNKKEVRFLDYAKSTSVKFADSLIEIQEVLREEFVKTLNEVMNELWGYIYPYEDYTGIRFKIENRDYLLQLCDLKNRWVNVEGFSSGGERVIASLVMRIALSVVLAPNLKLLVLDEPTPNLDSNTIENLTEVLRTKITELFEQVFIVTHDERMTQAGTDYIYEFKRELSKKEPTKIKERSIYENESFNLK